MFGFQQTEQQCKTQLYDLQWQTADGYAFTGKVMNYEPMTFKINKMSLWLSGLITTLTLNLSLDLKPFDLKLWSVHFSLKMPSVEHLAKFPQASFKISC